MKFFLILIEIFSLLFIVSCKKNETILQDNAICSTLLKLDTVWQVHLDSAYTVLYPSSLNHRLIYYMYSVNSGNNYVVIRNVENGEVTSKSQNEPFNFTDLQIFYDNKIVIPRLNSPNFKTTRFNFFDPVSLTYTYYDVPGDIGGIQLGDALLGTIHDSTSLSFYSYNFRTKNLKLSKPIKKNSFLDMYGYYPVIPFINQYGDTLIAYNTTIGHSSKYGSYNFSKNINYFDETINDDAARYIRSMEANGNIYLTQGNSYPIGNFTCINPYDNHILWQLDLSKDVFPFTQVFGKSVFYSTTKEFSYLEAQTGKTLWKNSYPDSSYVQKTLSSGNLLFILSNLFGKNTSSIIIADVNTGCIYRNISIENHNPYLIDKMRTNSVTNFYVDESNRLLYIFGVDNKLSCIKF